MIDDLHVYEMSAAVVPQGKQAQRRNLVRETLDSSAQAHARTTGSIGFRAAGNSAWPWRPVVGNPKLILADEPTGNLDSKNGEEVMGMLTTLNEQGATVLMVTHSPSDAARAHRIVYLLDGRVVPANQLAI